LRGWDLYFRFTDDDDIGFTRYYFPGQADNDYWHDPGVFGHFLQEVVDPPDPEGRPKVLQPAGKVRFEKPRGAALPWLVKECDAGNLLQAYDCARSL
jgi:hypothetical protein